MVLSTTSGWSTSKEEPMDYDSDILEEEESAQPADSEEQSLFGFGGGTIFEQDVPAPTPQPSQYGIHKLLLTSMFQLRRRILAFLHVPWQQRLPFSQLIWTGIRKLKQKLLLIKCRRKK